MAGTVTELHRRLLDSPTLPVDVQQHIFDAATAAKDNRLLAALAHTPSLSPTIDEQIRGCRTAAITAAWVSRPGRSSADIVDVIAGERRITVLKAAAAARGLGDATYRSIAEQMQPRIAAALIANPDVPADVKHAATEAYSSGSRYTSWKVRNEAVALFAGRPELHDTFARAATSIDALPIVAASDLSQEAVEHIAAFVAGWLVDESNPERFSYGVSPLLSTIAEFGKNPSVGSDARAMLIEALDEWSADSQGRDWMQRNAQDARAALVAGASPAHFGASVATRARAAEAITATDPGRLDEIAQWASTNADQAVAVAVALNPNSDVRHVERISRLVRRFGDHVLASRTDNIAVFAHLGADALQSSVTDELLAATGDGEAALSALLAEKGRAGNRHRITDLLSSRFCTQKVIRSAPIWLLSQSKTPPHVTAEVAAVIGERLGGSTRKWEVFETIGADFEGGLDELIDICDAVDDHAT